MFAEYPGAYIVEGVGVGEGHDLLADVFGGGLEGAVVFLGPDHPGEEVVVATFIDCLENLLGVLKAVGADDEALGFELACKRRGRGPLEPLDGIVVL